MKANIFLAGLLALLLLGLCACAAPNKTVTLELEENPTTGYSWSYTMEGDALKETASEYVAPTTGLTGAPGKHVWTFTGSGDGEVALTFLYAQPWEGGSKGDTRIYRYAVKKGVATLLSEETLEAPAAEEILLRVDAVRTEGTAILVDAVYLQSEWVEPENEGDTGYTNLTALDGTTHTLTLSPNAYINFSEDLGPDTVEVTPAEFAEKFAARQFNDGVNYTAMVTGEEIQSLYFLYME